MTDDVRATVADLCAHDAIAPGELQALYEQLDAEVAQLGPVCELSGRCCRFQDYGHTLFVSALEFRFLLEHAPNPTRPLDRGESCPWQDWSGRCTARAGRPLGCRVYYCDPSYERSANELSERYIARLKEYTNKHGLPWRYAPFHRHLEEEHARGSSLFEVAAQMPRCLEKVSP
jgi:hypothetical protein